jgi:hypothetical protein
MLLLYYNEKIIEHRHLSLGYLSNIVNLLHFGCGEVLNLARRLPRYFSIKQNFPQCVGATNGERAVLQEVMT